MRTLTCSPKTFAVFAATISFVALAAPIWLTAQVEQEQPKDQTNYFVKNLDTLEDTGTVVRCISNASPVFADTRPGAPERADSAPQYNGYCEVSGINTLTGECLHPNFDGQCTFYVDGTCPRGRKVPKQDVSFVVCSKGSLYRVDRLITCH